MLPFTAFPFEAVFAVSLCISQYFVESDGIISNRSAENQTMMMVVQNNHKEAKNYDEPESYRKMPEEEKIRNAQQNAIFGIG